MVSGMAAHSRNTTLNRIKGIKNPMVSGNNYRKGDIVFAEHVSFEGNAGSKARPIVFLGYEDGHVRYAKCTTSFSNRILQLPIEDLISAGLDRETYMVPVVKHIERSNLKYRLGHLCEDDLEALQENIKN